MKHLHLIHLITPPKDIINYIFSCKITAMDWKLQKHQIFKML